MKYYFVAHLRQRIKAANQAGGHAGQTIAGNAAIISAIVGWGISPPWKSSSIEYPIALQASIHCANAMPSA